MGGEKVSKQINFCASVVTKATYVSEALRREDGKEDLKE